MPAASVVAYVQTPRSVDQRRSVRKTACSIGTSLESWVKGGVMAGVALLGSKREVGMEGEMKEVGGRVGKAVGG